MGRRTLARAAAAAAAVLIALLLVAIAPHDGPSGARGAGQMRAVQAWALLSPPRLLHYHHRRRQLSRKRRPGLFSASSWSACSVASGCRKGGGGGKGRPLLGGRRSFGGRTAGSAASSPTELGAVAAGAAAAAATSAAAPAPTTAAAVATMKAGTMVAGKVWPALRRLASLVHPGEVMKAAKGVHVHLHPQDWAFLAVLGCVGYVRIFERRSGRSSSDADADADAEMDSNVASKRPHVVVSALLQRVAVVRAVQELAQVAFASYLVDILCLMLRLQGVHFPHLWDVPRVFAKTSLSLWALRLFLRQKRDFLKRQFGSAASGGSSGSASSSNVTLDLVDRVVNVVCVGFMALLISDWVSVELGLAFKGAVTMGGLGTLAFTLASKDLASQVVSGMFLQAGNKMRSGEKVALGSSTGKVVKIGLTETVLRASDNTITSIPNAKVSQDKVINYSRVPVSQVEQKLRFHLEDVDELPAVLESIRSEIRASCPKVILDGSRPFRVFFTNYAENSLEVMVDTHFAISPTSDEYWVNRQEVLMAIHRAVKSHRIQYAYSAFRDDSNEGRERGMGVPSSDPTIPPPLAS